MAADWRSLALAIEPKARMTAPATEGEIAEVERAVGSPFPADLRSLFLQTNGGMDDGYGPILCLANTHPVPFADRHGTVVAQTPFPAYSITEYTLLQRSEDFAKLNGWDDETRALLNTFVVVGLDIGGNMFGFFAGPAKHAVIRYIEHDTVFVDEASYSLEQYLRFYFAECRWFDDET